MPLAIQFSLAGEIQDRLDARARARATSPSLVAKGDLLDYWETLRVNTPTFSPDEAALLRDATNGTHHDAATATLLWATVEDALEADALAGTYPAVDGPALVARLRRGLDRVEQIALVRAIDLAWDLMAGPEGLELAEALRVAGLVGGDDRP